MWHPNSFRFINYEDIVAFLSANAFQCKLAKHFLISHPKKCLFQQVLTSDFFVPAVIRSIHAHPDFNPERYACGGRGDHPMSAKKKVKPCCLAP